MDGLSNADFRKLMMTPRAPQSGSDSSFFGSSHGKGGSSSRSQQDSRARKHQHNKQQRKQGNHQRRPQQRDEEESEEERSPSPKGDPNYRDRAAERRKEGESLIATADGSLVDEEVLLRLKEEDPLLPIPANITAALKETAASRMVLGVHSILEDEDRSKNKSKNVLDFDALRKAREKIEREMKLQEETKAIEEKATKPKITKEEEAKKKATSSAAKAALSLLENMEKRKEAVKRIMHLPNTDRFYSGRTSFIFETVEPEDAWVDPDSPFHNDIPTTVITSKADLPNCFEIAKANLGKSLSDLLQESLDIINGKKKRKKKHNLAIIEEHTMPQAPVTSTPKIDKPVTNGTKLVPVIDDDDDIFSGVGREFTVTSKKEEQKEEPMDMAGPSRPPDDYDFDDDIFSKEPEEQEEPRPTTSKSKSKYFGDNMEEDEEVKGPDADAFLKEIQRAQEISHLVAQKKAAEEKIKEISSEQEIDDPKELQKLKDQGLATVFRRPSGSNTKNTKKDKKDESDDTYTECFMTELDTPSTRKSTLAKLVYGDEDESEEGQKASKQSFAGVDRVVEKKRKPERLSDQFGHKDRKSKKKMSRNAKINRDYDKIQQIWKKDEEKQK